MSFGGDFDLFGEYNGDAMNAIVAGLSGLTVQHPADTTSSKSKKKRATDVANEFKLHFGSNVSNLGSWQELCRVVGITNIPSSITQCKKLLKNIHVNIFDLVDAARSNTVARTFMNTAQLADYSKTHNKVFPKSAAKKDKLLKFMLKIIFD